MEFALFALLVAAWGMGWGFFIYRFGPAGVKKMQRPILDQAAKRGRSGIAGPMAKWQIFIVKLGGAVFFLAGTTALVMAVLNATAWSI
ncbi:MAG: hypothetical protein ACM31P_12035 [Actinomycetota bacterium]